MSALMKALVYEGSRDMNLRDKPIPEINGDEVLIEVKFTGICGSELGGYLGHNSLRVPPLVMGHEFAGEVVALGTGAQSLNPSISLGRVVTVNPLAYCGHCEFCRQGLNQ